MNSGKNLRTDEEGSAELSDPPFQVMTPELTVFQKERKLNITHSDGSSDGLFLEDMTGRLVEKDGASMFNVQSSS